MEKNQNKMKIDVVIPVYKPDKVFEKTLKRLENQTLKPERLILINTERDFFDETLIQNLSNVEVHHITKEQFDHGGTRHEGMMMSNAEIVVFMTQDAIPYDEYLLENLVKPFEDPQVSVVYGRQMADKKKNLLEAFTRTFNYPKESRKKTKEDLEQLGIKTFFCSNVCSAYRRTDYEQAGGFSRNTIFNEDMILASKFIEMGKAVYYEADAKVWHWHDYSAMEQLHRNFDLAVSQQKYGGLFLTVKSESEGIRLVLATMKYLVKNGKFYLVPKLIWHSGFKWIGYKLGRNYEKLPKNMILKLTMNKAYWKKD